MKTIRFIMSQYRLSCRAGFGRRKSLRRAVNIYVSGF
jgi:hypothetical protein